MRYLAALALFITGCSNALTSEGPSVERVFPRETGYSCFLLRDETGKAVGGSCLKD
jgi:hypothetical protein